MTQLELQLMEHLRRGIAAKSEAERTAARNEFLKLTHSTVKERSLEFIKRSKEYSLPSPETNDLEAAAIHELATEFNHISRDTGVIPSQYDFIGHIVGVIDRSMDREASPLRMSAFLSTLASTLTVHFAPGVTPEQHRVALEALGDLFELAGGKGGLRVIRSEQFEGTPARELLP